MEDSTDRSAVASYDTLASNPLLPLLIPQRPTLQGRPHAWLLDPRMASRDPQQLLTAFIEHQAARPDAGQARTLLTPLVEDALDALERWRIPYLQELQELPGQCSRAS